MTTAAAAVPSVSPMNAWGPGNGGPEVLSLGDLGTTRLSTARVVARALLCLGVGVFLEAHFFADTLAVRESGVADAAASAVAAGSSGSSGSGSVGCVTGRPDRARADCPPGRPARASDLTGTWLRTGVHGVWRGLEGRELMRFDADGGFTWGLAGPYRALRGRYLLSGGTVTVTAMRRSLCHAGDTYTWRATLPRAGRLHLAHVPGTERDGCTVSPEVWSGRRLQGDLVTTLLDR